MSDQRLSRAASNVPSTASSAEPHPQQPPPVQNEYDEIFADLGLRQDDSLAGLPSTDSNSILPSMDDYLARNSSQTSSGLDATPTQAMGPTKSALGTAVSRATANDTASISATILNVNIPQILPHEQVFSIQVGDTMFRLSGASLSSDAPSYFTRFFNSQRTGNSKQNPVLYIDRSPEIFREIVRHLQGYYVVPKDAYHFVYLYADAHYYQLPKLAKLLFNSEIFVRIGGDEFTLSRELFTQPGDTPNFFSLGFSTFFSSPQEIFPGTRGLIRPPAVAPPFVPTHSNFLFGQLLQALKGTPIKFESTEHRDALLRECRYYHFRGLEQRLIPFAISKNLLTGREEISIRLKDLKWQGASIESNPHATRRRIEYKRPFVDNEARELIVQVERDEFTLRAYDVMAGEESMKSKCRWCVEVTDGSTACEKLRTLFQKLPAVSDETDDYGLLRLRVDLRDAAITVNGVDVDGQESSDGFVEIVADDNSWRKRKRVEGSEPAQISTDAPFPTKLSVQSGQLKMYVMKERLVLHALCLDAISTLKEVNRRRAYLV
ncbi:hypothetical protein V1525DRAFT_397850 [Lipomyces kononenkoae]|uniref:Uncharacterized protein n=1 Tax=Lipomyces kononenkoae TaxID=34357 RepID=A0ACC3T6N5_LIPKO